MIANELRLYELNNVEFESRKTINFAECPLASWFKLNGKTGKITKSMKLKLGKSIRKKAEIIALMQSAGYTVVHINQSIRDYFSDKDNLELVDFHIDCIAKKSDKEYLIMVKGFENKTLVKAEKDRFLPKHVFDKMQLLLHFTKIETGVVLFRKKYNEINEVVVRGQENFVKGALEQLNKQITIATGNKQPKIETNGWDGNCRYCEFNHICRNNNNGNGKIFGQQRFDRSFESRMKG